jgi:hypothetical protein
MMQQDENAPYWLHYTVASEAGWFLVAGEDSALEFESIDEAVAFWRDYRVKILEMQRRGDFPAGKVLFAIDRAGRDDQKFLVFLPYDPEAEAEG